MSVPFGWLVLVLRGTAVQFLLALVGVALPESWMKAVYEWGGLGPWPGGADPCSFPPVRVLGAVGSVPVL